MSDHVLKSAVEVAQRITEGQLQGCLVSEVDLSKDGLANARATDVTFRRVALHDADATRGQYSRAKFAEASCRGARFDHSLFRGASFFNCELIEASFANANMAGSSFFNARLGNANFGGSRIQSGVFNSCELFSARFPRALIVNTRFEAAERGNVTLDRADFSNAVLIDCDMMGANLFGANFQNALLIKVDLRHANIAQANFEGARLIDVQVDLSALEPGDRRMIERARFDDPWRNHGFMQEVLAPYSAEEMHRMLEYVLRTYIIEAAQPTSEADTFQGLLAGMKARHDFPELELIRVRNGVVQVRHGLGWYDLGAPIEGGEGSGDVLPASSASLGSAPSPAPAPASAGRDSRDDGPRLRRPELDPADAKPRSNEPPKRVAASKRFKKLEMD